MRFYLKLKTIYMKLNFVLKISVLIRTQFGDSDLIKMPLNPSI